MSKSVGETNLHKLIELSPIACIATDPNQPDNPIVAANAAFAALTGYAVEEVLGRNCRFLTGPGTEPEARALLRAAVKDHASVVVELTNYRADGTSFRNAVMIAPYFDESGALSFYIGSQMDAGERGLSDRRQVAGDAVAGLSRRQVDVLRHMAHGMRHAQIAEALGITDKTVKMHRAALVKRLGCRTSAEAIRIAVEAGL